MARRLATLVVLTIGCGPTVVADGGTGGGSSTSAGTTATTNGVTTTTTTAPLDDAEAEVESGVVDGPFPEDWGTIGAVCDVTPGFTCTAGVDCNRWSCGDPYSPFDEDGCPRPHCPCLDGEVCFVPAEWGACVSSGITCEAGGGASCHCALDPDCGGSFCLPVDDVPVAPCIDLVDAASCGASNCRWIDGTRYRHSDGECTCAAGSGFCVSPLDYRETPGPAGYYRLDDPDVGVAFEVALQPTPMGLGACDGTGPVGVCECIAGGC